MGGEHGNVIKFDVCVHTSSGFSERKIMLPLFRNYKVFLRRPYLCSAHPDCLEGQPRAERQKDI